MPLKRLAAPVALAIGLGGFLFLDGHGNGGDEGAAAGGPIVTLAVPKSLSAQATAGRATFDLHCASCHGQNAAGRDGIAPPLVHVIYEPGHHGDESFQRAVAAGVRSHHWRFGDMAPVEGLNRRDVAGIVDYIRELQRANGIH